MTDAELLWRFTQLSDRAAMDELVRRHVDFVYATARRQLGDGHAAEDVTQAVFLLMARKAPSIDAERLAGWLFRSTCYAAANAMRIAARRAFHESRAARQKREQVMDAHVTAPDAAPLLAMLDDALSSLRPNDREAVILRYLQGRDLAAVCAATGIGPAAARKRISRAVDRLRLFFARRGIIAPTSTVLSALALASSERAPAAILLKASAAACGAAAPAAASIAKGVTLMTAASKAKVAAVVAGALLVSATIGAQVTHRIVGTAPVAMALAAAPAPAQPMGNPQALQYLDAVRRAITCPVQQYYSAFHSDSTGDFATGPEHVSTEKMDSHYFRDGANIDVTFQMRVHRPDQRPADNVFGRRYISARTFVAYDTVDGSIPNRALYNPSGPDLRGATIAQLQGAEALEGYLAHDDLPFWTILAEYRDLQAGIEASPQDGGAPLLHLHGKGSHGTYDLWCDPATYAMRRAVVEKNDGDRFSGMTIGKLSPPARSAIDKYRLEMLVTELGTDAGFHRIDRVKVTSYMHTTAGRQVTSVGEIRRTAFEVHPQFAARGAFDPPLRANTPMNGLNMGGRVQFVWRNRGVELVPGTASPGSLQAAIEQSGPAIKTAPMPLASSGAPRGGPSGGQTQAALQAVEAPGTPLFSKGKAAALIALCAALAAVITIAASRRRATKEPRP